MAVGTIIKGASLVKIQANSGSLLTLGYGRNSIEITENPFMIDVPGDENGGDEGPPVDVEWLGMTHTIRCRLSKWDETVANELHKMVPGTTKGTPAEVGTLMFAGSNAFRVLIEPANPAGQTSDPRNYPRCLMRAPIDIPFGSKFSELIVEFTAYKTDAGLLYNAVTTA